MLSSPVAADSCLCPKILSSLSHLGRGKLQVWLCLTRSVFKTHDLSPFSLMNYEFIKSGSTLQEQYRKN